MQRKWTVLVDTREKKPLLFPHSMRVLSPDHLPRKRVPVRVELTTRRARLETGDYAMQGYPNSVLVERKSGLREVAGNCLTGDRRRFVECLERLRAACTGPVLLLEGSPSSLLTAPAGKGEPDPVLGFDSLLRLLVEYHVQLVMLPTSSLAQRKAAGEVVARLMLAGALSWPSTSTPTPSTSTEPRPSETSSPATAPP
jgi:ERCC4-type nuclease